MAMWVITRLHYLSNHCTKPDWTFSFYLLTGKIVQSKGHLDKDKRKPLKALSQSALQTLQTLMLRHWFDGPSSDCGKLGPDNTIHYSSGRSVVWCVHDIHQMRPSDPYITCPLQYARYQCRTITSLYSTLKIIGVLHLTGYGSYQHQNSCNGSLDHSTFSHFSLVQL